VQVFVLLSAVNISEFLIWDKKDKITLGEKKLVFFKNKA
jgi:hypothetical protein